MRFDFKSNQRLRVTGQLLDNTPAVPSLGKLCEEHGSSYEWITGRQPQLTKNGNTITSKTDIFVFLVVPGLSSSSSSSSSSTSKTQDQSTHSGESGSASSDPVTHQRDKPAAGNRMPTDLTNQLREAACRRHKTGRTRKIQLKTFLIGCRFLQLISRTWRKMCPHVSDSEGFTKVVDKRY